MIFTKCFIPFLKTQPSAEWITIDYQLRGFRNSLLFFFWSPKAFIKPITLFYLLYSRTDWKTLHLCLFHFQDAIFIEGPHSKIIYCCGFARQELFSSGDTLTGNADKAFQNSTVSLNGALLMLHRRTSASLAIVFHKRVDSFQ